MEAPDFVRDRTGIRGGFGRAEGDVGEVGEVGLLVPFWMVHAWSAPDPKTSSSSGISPLSFVKGDRIRWFATASSICSMIALVLISSFATCRRRLPTLKTLVRKPIQERYRLSFWQMSGKRADVKVSQIILAEITSQVNPQDLPRAGNPTIKMTSLGPTSFLFSRRSESSRNIDK